jgi:5-dehydro-2-deoxygluconokinase
VAVAAARLGHPSAVITSVGDDDFGRYIRSALGEFAVSTAVGSARTRTSGPPGVL